MLPLIIESDSPDLLTTYLNEHYYLQNLVSEVKAENNSIGLQAIKYLIDRAKFSHPEKSIAVFLIYDGHLITPAGQNALLKTLEEAKSYEQFIITVPNHHLLLETVVSRCRIISLTPTNKRIPDPDALKNFVTYLRSSAVVIRRSDEILSADPEDKIKNIILDLHDANRHFPTTKRVKIIFFALECLTDLDRNINPKLAIDHFLLQSHRLLKKST